MMVSVCPCFGSLLVALIFPSVLALRRDYYIQATEQWWDYAPSKDNLITNDRSISDGKLKTREDRIGSMYKKVMLKEFTDGTFRHEIPMPPWMGYIGPLIKGETGDVLYIHFNNLANRPYSLHPHGVQYFKDSEGALYADGTKGADKLDDMVPPGATYTYKWYLTKTFAPTEEDDNCLPLGYHPHVRSPKDIDTGLVGMMVVCKPGTLDAMGRRKDVDKEFVLYVDLVNETNSWLIEDNLERCGNPRRCRQLFDEKDAGFISDSIMYQVNGYTYGNLPPFPVHEGEKVVFYAFGLNLGSHPVGIQGQSLVVKDMRSHAYAFGSALFEGLYMVPRNPGRWLLFCKRTYHFQHGMAAFVDVMPARFPLPPAVLVPVIRRYFLAIEEVVWSYIPAKTILARVGQQSEERSMTERRFFDSPGAVGGKFVKAMYTEYTDESFKVVKPRGPELEHLGILGPPIKIAVGEVLEVYLLNKAGRPYSFNPFGLSFTKDNEGAYYKNGPKGPMESGAIVRPGELRRYVFTVPPEFGPTKHDPPCITESYQSFVDFTRDMYSGLGGPLLICKPGALNLNNKQVGVDREFYIMPMVWYEQDSWYMNDSIALAMQSGKHVDRTDPGFRDANSMRAINGLIFGNLRGLEMCIGDRVSWHIFGFGERFEHHATIFEGNNLFYEGRKVDHMVVRAGTAETALMIPDNKGTWLLHGGQLDAQTDGMVTTYNVFQCNIPPPPISIQPIKRLIRRYFIAAVDVEWDYLPRNKMHPMTLTDIRDKESPGNLYVRDDDMFIGTCYKKTVYREFTDDSFTVMRPRGKRDMHLGILGPFIRVEVGDILEVVYKNMASFNNSITFKGLAIDNIPYADTKYGVMPGQIKVYRWVVPERSGPGKREPNCIGSNYNSPVYPRKDVATGLVGPLVICRKGILDFAGNRRDQIDREFALGFIIFNEANSHYFDENVRNKAPGRRDRMDSIFRESNMKYTMNGLLFQNIDGLVMKEGEKVAWYIFSFGSILGEHTSHFHGLTFIRRTNMAVRDDVVGVVPGSYETVEMFADNPGTWLVHCHVGLHMTAGMNGVYTVLPNDIIGHEIKTRRKVFEVAYNRFDMRYNSMNKLQ